jgi:hypothetical protein
MKNIIDDPEETEHLLLEAGFIVRLNGMGFEVLLKHRRVARWEVGAVLGCEEEDLETTPNGVLVR